IEFDLARILHGEQYIEVYGPLPSEAKLRSEARVVDILDKGSGALILSEVTTYDNATGKKLAMQQVCTFQVGSGKFGGPRTSSHEKPAAEIPTRQPDAVFEEKTSVDQIMAVSRLRTEKPDRLRVPYFRASPQYGSPDPHPCNEKSRNSRSFRQPCTEWALAISISPVND
ncbi:hypothetical protein COOONC_11937, partial [Cooperia oncophora]